MSKYLSLGVIALLLIGCSRPSHRVTQTTLSTPSSTLGEHRVTPQLPHRVTPQTINENLLAVRFLVSPDGNSIALCTSEKATIWNINLANGARRQLGEEWDCNTLYAWRPKSRQVFFLREIPIGTGTGAIVSVDADTGRTEVVVPDHASYFALSPDGQRLAYSLGGLGEIQALWVMNLESARAGQVATGWIGPFIWSVDGKQLLYNVSTQKEHAQQLGPRGFNHGYLAAYSIASGQRQQITPEFKQVGIAVWSPDGQWVTFDATREQAEDPEVFLMAADGSELHPIGAEPGTSVAAAWSPQSDRLLFTNTGTPDSEAGRGLWLHRMDTETNVLLAKGNIRTAAFSPDGKRIVFFQDNRLLIMPVEGEAVLAVVENVAEGDFLPSFQWLSATELAYLKPGGIIQTETVP